MEFIHKSQIFRRLYFSDFVTHIWGDCVCSVLSHVWPLCDPVDGSLSGSSVRGILQARILKWVAISFSRGSFWLRDRTHVSCVSTLLGGFFTIEPPREPILDIKHALKKWWLLLLLQLLLLFCWLTWRKRKPAGPFLTTTDTVQPRAWYPSVEYIW